MNFLIFSSPSFKSRFEVCYSSIVKHHPEAFITHINVECTGSGYIPGMAKQRLEKALEMLKSGDSHVIILGADCVLYSPLLELKESLVNPDINIVLVPHAVSPTSSREHMAQLYRTGHANADFIVFKNTPTTIRALEWLISVVQDDNQINGIFYEQTWVSALPFLFDGVSILRHPGYNWGYWEPTRDISNLRFVQFSGFEKGKPERMSKYYSGPDVTGEILDIYRGYDGKV